MRSSPSAADTGGKAANLTTNKDLEDDESEDTLAEATSDKEQEEQGLSTSPTAEVTDAPSGPGWK